MTEPRDIAGQDQGVAFGPGSRPSDGAASVSTADAASIPNAVEYLAKAEWEWERGLIDGATPDWDEIALPLRRSRLRHAEYLLNAVASIAALAAMRAKLPEGYLWGRDAMEQFNFGKRRAAQAIMGLASGIEAAKPDRPHSGLDPEGESPVGEAETPNHPSLLQEPPHE